MFRVMGVIRFLKTGKVWINPQEGCPITTAFLALFVLFVFQVHPGLFKACANLLIQHGKSSKKLTDPSSSRIWFQIFSKLSQSPYYMLCNMSLKGDG